MDQAANRVEERQSQLARLKAILKESPCKSLVLLLWFQVNYGSLTDEDSRFLKE